MSQGGGLYNESAQAPPEGADERTACLGPLLGPCIQRAANSPAGQWAQRMAARYGTQAVNWARTNGPRVWQWAQQAARGAPTIGRTLNDTVGSGAANTVRDVLKGHQQLSALSAPHRAAAAAWYRDVATRTAGRYAAEASRYNIARAEFLEGTRSSLSPTLPEFIKNGFK